MNIKTFFLDSGLFVEASGTPEEMVEYTIGVMRHHVPAVTPIVNDLPEWKCLMKEPPNSASKVTKAVQPSSRYKRSTDIVKAAIIRTLSGDSPVDLYVLYGNEHTFWKLISDGRLIDDVKASSKYRSFRWAKTKYGRGHALSLAIRELIQTKKYTGSVTRLKGKTIYKIERRP